MSTIRNIVLTTLLMASCALQADTLTIPGHYESDNGIALPQRGISMERVLSEFGEPIDRKAAVGEPPITEWDYGDFRVYFEFQTVLHSVNLKTMIMPQ
ncbi:MAG: phosphodiesterase [Gammaproteobacteria bacterium]|nr:phosphodiesterase [Gammaproteobacteria bacterium]